MISPMDGEYSMHRKTIGISGSDMKDKWAMEICTVEENCSMPTTQYSKDNFKTAKFLEEDAESIQTVA